MGQKILAERMEVGVDRERTPGKLLRSISGSDLDLPESNCRL